MKKRVGFDEFEVPIPKGHERITDKDDSTDYLFVTAPNDIYTLYFDSKKSAEEFYVDGSGITGKFAELDGKWVYFGDSEAIEAFTK